MVGKKNDYRERALKLFPWVCGVCTREFDGKNLRELTVHHKDHDHDNNPLDGSNWELLCLYCHDNEHAKQAVADALADPPAEKKMQNKTTSSYKAFEGLQALIDKKKK